MTDLRPCPNPECVETVGPWLWPLTDAWPYATVECRDCLLVSPRCDSDAEAIRLWNAFPRRDTEAQITHSKLCWNWHLDCAIREVGKWKSLFLATAQDISAVCKASRFEGEAEPPAIIEHVSRLREDRERLEAESARFARWVRSLYDSQADECPECGVLMDLDEDHDHDDGCGFTAWLRKETT